MIRGTAGRISLGVVLVAMAAGAEDPPPDRPPRTAPPPSPRAVVRRPTAEQPDAEPVRKTRRPTAAELAAAARAELGVELPLPPEATAYRATFFEEIRKAESASEQLVFAHGIAYAERLRQLQYAFQVAGRLGDLILVYDEIQRLQNEKKPPSPSPAMEPAELRLLAEDYVLSLRTARHSNDVHVARASADYIQQLAVLRRSMAERDGGDLLLMLDAERDRLLTNAVIRQAVDGSVAKPGTLAADMISTDMTAREFNDIILRLYRPTNESVDAITAHSIDVGMTEDSSGMADRKTSSGRGEATSRSGKLNYTFRVTVSGRARDVPSGSRIVVEYFARSMTDDAREYVKAEEAILPAILAGESYTADLKGFTVAQTVSISVTTSGMTRSYTGSEFYGIIVSLLNPTGGVVMQRFFPQYLSRHLSPTPGLR